MPRPVLTEPSKKHQKMIALRESGLSAAQVAERMGSCSQWVHRVLARWRPDLSQDCVPHEQEFIRFCRKLWDRGLTASEIARRSGVTKNVIIGLANRNNFAARPSPIRRAA